VLTSPTRRSSYVLTVGPSQDDGRRAVRLKLPKTAEIRKVDLNDATVAILDSPRSMTTLTDAMLSSVSAVAPRAPS
jgi:hypothetical protein